MSEETTKANGAANLKPAKKSERRKAAAVETELEKENREVASNEHVVSPIVTKRRRNTSDALVHAKLMQAEDALCSEIQENQKTQATGESVNPKETRKSPRRSLQSEMPAKEQPQATGESINPKETRKSPRRSLQSEMPAKEQPQVTSESINPKETRKSSRRSLQSETPKSSTSSELEQDNTGSSKTRGKKRALLQPSDKDVVKKVETSASINKKKGSKRNSLSSEKINMALSLPLAKDSTCVGEWEKDAWIEVSYFVESKKTTVWYKARIVEIDGEAGRVKVHFHGWNLRYDAWYDAKSSDLRALRDADIPAVKSNKKKAPSANKARQVDESIAENRVEQGGEMATPVQHSSLKNPGSNSSGKKKVIFQLNSKECEQME